MSNDGARGVGQAAQKRSRDSPFVADYRPYTGRQLERFLERKATHKDHWNMYYRNNTVNGYRDRHYIIREFHELRQALDALREKLMPLEDLLWMEVGCGVGNAILPILEDYGDVEGWRVVGFDISSVAIALLDAKRKTLSPNHNSKLALRVLNPVEERIVTVSSVSSSSSPLLTRGCSISEGSVDFASMIFVLCSIPLEKHTLVLQRVAACMKDEGVFFFRDYCVGDHAEARFDTHRQVQVNTFARTNGTLSHFFSVDEVRQLFQEVGLEVLELSVVEREVLNRREGMNLHRKFLQGRFKKSKGKIVKASSEE